MTNSTMGDALERAGVDLDENTLKAEPQLRLKRYVAEAVAKCGGDETAGVEALSLALEDDPEAMLCAFEAEFLAAQIRRLYRQGMKRNGARADLGRDSDLSAGPAPERAGGDGPDGGDDLGAPRSPNSPSRKTAMLAASKTTHPWASQIKTPFGRAPDLDVVHMRTMQQRTGLVAGWFAWATATMQERNAKPGQPASEILTDKEMRRAARDALLGLQMFGLKEAS